MLELGRGYHADGFTHLRFLGQRNQMAAQGVMRAAPNPPIVARSSTYGAVEVKDTSVVVDAMKRLLQLHTEPTITKIPPTGSSGVTWNHCRVWTWNS